MIYFYLFFPLTTTPSQRMFVHNLVLFRCIAVFLWVFSVFLCPYIFRRQYRKYGILKDGIAFCHQSLIILGLSPFFCPVFTCIHANELLLDVVSDFNDILGTNGTFGTYTNIGGTSIYTSFTVCIIIWSITGLQNGTRDVILHHFYISFVVWCYLARAFLLYAFE